MKILLINIVTLLVGSAGTAFAASNASNPAGSGVLIWFFIGLAVMVLLFQATPAVVTFVGMLKGLFSTAPTEATFSPFKGKGSK